MRRVSARLIVVVLILVVMTQPGLGRSNTAAEKPMTVEGVWFGTVFLGDPASPATPKEQFLATVHRDGTYILDSTAETGAHPLNPGDKTPEHGVWTQRGLSVSTRGFFFDEAGGGLGFSVGRGVAQLQFVAPDSLSGLADFDFLPCQAGPLGCPDPLETDALEIGNGFGPFPVTMRRVR